MSPASLELHFYSYRGRLELVLSKFCYPELGITSIAARGKTCTALKNGGSFQWTRAVQALCIVLLKYHLHGDSSNEQYVEIGDQDSVASSLDLAIARAPKWIGDMFGLSHRGQLIARKIFLRTNSERRLLGPVIVSIDGHKLKASSIDFYLNRNMVADKEILLMMRKQLLSQFYRDIDPQTEKELLVPLNRFEV